VNGKILAVIAGWAIVATAAPTAAQSVAQKARELSRVITPQQRQARYPIRVMERVLEDAVEHGASITRDRLQAVLPAQTLLMTNPRVRGYRLEGYGVFFDVEVPSLETSMPWILQTLDQNNLDVQSALREIKQFVETAGKPNLEQALRRIEIQVAPFIPPTVTTVGELPRRAGATVPPAGATGAADGGDPVTNFQETYRAEVIHALSDAMLDHSGPLEIGAEEWLTVAAQRNEIRPRIGPLDNGAQTYIMRVRGNDLKAFRVGQLSREEAIKRVEVRVF
jgi:hypothetical protein